MVNEKLPHGESYMRISLRSQRRRPWIRLAMDTIGHGYDWGQTCPHVSICQASIHDAKRAL